MSQQVQVTPNIENKPLMMKSQTQQNLSKGAFNKNVVCESLDFSKQQFGNSQNNLLRRTMSNEQLSQLNMMKSQRSDVMQQHYCKLMEANDLHFKQVAGQTLKQMCSCGRCKQEADFNLLLDYKKCGETQYQSEFKQKNYQNDKIDTTYYTTQYYNRQPIDLKTIYRTEYNTKQQDPYNTQHKNFWSTVDKFLPFAGVSSYRNSFINYPNNPVSALKPPQHPTVIKDLPFIGSTTYGSTFQGRPAEFDPEMEKIKTKYKRGQFKSPLNSDIPLLAETTNQYSYQPYKTKNAPFNFNKTKKYDPLPNFDGQFVSEYKKDFDSKKGAECPSRKILHIQYQKDLDVLQKKKKR